MTAGDARATGTAQPASETAGDAWSEAAAGAGPLDLLLSDAALGVLRRFWPDGSALHLGAALARRPKQTGRQLLALGTELAKVVVGRSELAPGRRDRRFADPAWTGNPVLRRSMQSYLAASRAAEQLLETAELDWRDNERLKFVVANLIAAAAPANNPLLSPAAAKSLIDTGGASAVRGVRAFLTDMSVPPRVPSMAEPGAFTVGRDLAVTPGAVVFRNEQLELIQYQPVTATVHRYPLLIVPPMINKYYITDLAPGRSLAEYLVAQGHQVFTVSWRNPDARHSAWNLDTYGGAVLAALDVLRSVTGAAKASLFALCSGGIVCSMLAAHLHEAGELDRLATMCLGVTILDQARAGTAGAMISERTARAATAVSRARGYLDGRALAEVFAWLRPDDLIWNYWVNNYLEGKPPPAFDILYWNADTTRLPAALHRDFIQIALANSLTVPGAATMLGSPVDLSKVDTESYVIAGVADHLCPWQSCYRTTQLLGGPARFVLSTSGHIASMVNPPDNPKATFRTAAANPPDPGGFLAAASAVSGSWWPDYASWLAGRSGGRRSSPARLGTNAYPVLAAAPGSYVHDH